MPRLTLPAIAALSLTLRAISTERVELRALASGRLALPTDMTQEDPPTDPPHLLLENGFALLLESGGLLLLE